MAKNHHLRQELRYRQHLPVELLRRHLRQWAVDRPYRLLLLVRLPFYRRHDRRGPYALLLFFIL
jgi:hypothetical protein